MKGIRRAFFPFSSMDLIKSLLSMYMQAVAGISLSKALQKESKGAVSSIIEVLEPQLETCRCSCPQRWLCARLVVDFCSEDLHQGVLRHV